MEKEWLAEYLRRYHFGQFNATTSRELELSIEELTEGLPAKKKLFRSLGLMGGLFLAILLF